MTQGTTAPDPKWSARDEAEFQRMTAMSLVCFIMSGATVTAFLDNPSLHSNMGVAVFAFGAGILFAIKSIKSIK
jgi:hypothetical protein